jgi:hypothetical protein
MNCIRCGIEIDLAILLKRKERGNLDSQCKDCRMKPQHEVKHNKVICRPWRGEVDEDLNPIDAKGRPYLPGARTCGYKDCVNRQHIIPELGTIDPLEAERIDISYRTKESLDIKKVIREAS